MISSRLCLWLAVFLLALGVCSPALGQGRDSGLVFESGTVPSILNKAISAGNHARYVGRRVVQFWRQDQARKHEEIVTRDGDRTRVEFPEGSKNAGQVIVENRFERRHYFPEHNELMIRPPHREESLERLVRMARRGESGKIQFAVGPGRRVAGLWTEQLVVADMRGNITQRLYIEPKSGVVLRREVFDAGGAKVGYFEFSQIDINPPPLDASLFKFERKGVKIVTPFDRLLTVAAKGRFQALTLPQGTGFKLDDVRIEHIGGQDVLVQSFWSHRGKLSMFQLKSPVDPDKLQKFAGADLHTYAWQANGVSLVLVGSASRDELDRLSQSTQQGNLVDK